MTNSSSAISFLEGAEAPPSAGGALGPAASSFGTVKPIGPGIGSLIGEYGGAGAFGG